MLLPCPGPDCLICRSRVPALVGLHVGSANILSLSLSVSESEVLADVVSSSMCDSASTSISALVLTLTSLVSWAKMAATNV